MFQHCVAFFLQDQNEIPRFLDSRLIVPGKVRGNSDYANFFLVSDVRDVDISCLRFYGCMRVEWTPPK